MKINTVNFIEMNQDDILQIISFPDTDKGNIEVEDLFSEFLMKQGITDGEDINNFIDDGYYDNDGHSISIIHSN
jgi:hypothetical protein